MAGPTPLSPGDALLVYDAALMEEKQIVALADGRVGAARSVTWTPAIQAVAWTSQATHVAKTTRAFRLFGFNAPDTYSTFVPGGTTTPNQWKTVPNTFNIAASQTAYPLDARYQDLKAGAVLLVDTATSGEPIRLVTVTKVAQVTATKGLLQDTVTEVTLSRVLRSAPTVSSWAANRLDLFARGGEDTLLHAWWSDGAWHGLESLGGRITWRRPPSPGAPTDRRRRARDGPCPLAPLVQWELARLGIARGHPLLGPGHLLLERQSPRHLRAGDGPCALAPLVEWRLARLAVARRQAQLGASGGILGPERIDVFARGLDNMLWHRWFDGSWHAWHSLETKLNGTPTVCARGVGRLELFDLTEDGQLRHGWFDGTWHGWDTLGGSLTSAAGAVSWGPSGSTRSDWAPTGPCATSPGPERPGQTGRRSVSALARYDPQKRASVPGRDTGPGASPLRLRRDDLGWAGDRSDRRSRRDRGRADGPPARRSDRPTRCRRGPGPRSSGSAVWTSPITWRSTSIQPSRPRWRPNRRSCSATWPRPATASRSTTRCWVTATPRTRSSASPFARSR